jgi:hypothetical protein
MSDVKCYWIGIVASVREINATVHALIMPNGIFVTAVYYPTNVKILLF